MSVRDRAHGVAPTGDVSGVEEALGRALILATTIVNARRSPTADESSIIEAARDRAGAAGVDTSEMFRTYMAHLAVRADIDAALARQEAERQERERRRAHWNGRPQRFLQLTPEQQLLHVVASFIPDGPVRGEDLRRALASARSELLQEPVARDVPFTFEESEALEAKRLGLTRNGIQSLGGPRDRQ